MGDCKSSSAERDVPSNDGNPKALVLVHKEETREPGNASVQELIPFDDPKPSATRTIMPVTCKQIKEAVTTDSSVGIIINNTEITTVKLVAMLKDTRADDLKVEFNLFDGTGTIRGVYWVFDMDPNGKLLEAIGDGTYVTIHGKIDPRRLTRNIQCFSIKKVIDYNEVTHHFLSVIHTHLSLKAGSSSKQQTATVTPCRPVPRAKPTSPIDYVETIREHEKMSDFVGVSIQELAVITGSPIESIRADLRGLLAVGEVYNTIDSDHFKATKMTQ